MKNISVIGASGLVSGSLFLVMIYWVGGNPIPMTMWVCFCGGMLVQSLIKR